MTDRHEIPGTGRQPGTQAEWRPPFTFVLSLRHVPSHLYEPPALTGDELFDWTGEEAEEGARRA